MNQKDAISKDTNFVIGNYLNIISAVQRRIRKCMFAKNIQSILFRFQFPLVFRLLLLLVLIKDIFIGSIGVCSDFVQFIRLTTRCNNTFKKRTELRFQAYVCLCIERRNNIALNCTKAWSRNNKFT